MPNTIAAGAYTADTVVLLDASGNVISVISSYQTDKTAFTEGSGRISVVGGVFNATRDGAVGADQASALRITDQGDLQVNSRNSSGTEIFVDAAPGKVQETGAWSHQGDSIQAVETIDKVSQDGTALTPKFAFANVAASQTDASIVAAVASKRLLVLAYRLHTGAVATNVTFNSKPGGAGSAISELFALGANGGHDSGYCPVGHFRTATGEGLTVTTGAGSTTGIGVVYVEAT